MAAALEHIRTLAGRDELTGLPNRRRMNQLMEQKLRRSGRAGSVFCLVMIDIDHFKRVNDTYGHAVGDEVLRAFAGIASLPAPSASDRQRRRICFVKIELRLPRRLESPHPARLNGRVAGERALGSS